MTVHYYIIVVLNHMYNQLLLCIILLVHYLFTSFALEYVLFCGYIIIWHIYARV